MKETIGYAIVSRKSNNIITHDEIFTCFMIFKTEQAARIYIREFGLTSRYPDFSFTMFDIKYEIVEVKIKSIN